LIYLAVLTTLTLNATANVFWNTSGTNDWHTAANWNPDTAVPGASDIVIINNGGTAKISTADAVSGRIEIGYKGGDGTLILDNHILTANDYLRMGFKAGKGTYVQSGSSSKLDMNNHNIFIANNISSVSTISIDAGVITNVSDMSCGCVGLGDLIINGGSFYSRVIYAGGDTWGGSNATGTITLNSGTIENSWRSYIGYNGTGILNIKGGVMNNADHLYIAENPGSTGTVTVTGGRLCTTNKSSYHIYLGNNGLGRLNVDGGEVIPHNLYLGYNAGAAGYLSLSNGIMHCSEIEIGENGTGYYTQSGGTNTASWAFSAGHLSGSRGTVTLSGGLLSLERDVSIGRAGGSHGEVTVSGGLLRVGDQLRIGTFTNSYGKLTIDDGRVELTGLSLIIGNIGTGVCVMAGGVLTNMSDIIVGYAAGSQGTLTITGGKIANSGNDMVLGRDPAAAGNLIIQGSGADINILRNLDCDNGSTNHLTFILDGDPGAVSTINCDSALLNNTNVTLEYKLGDDFHGLQRSEYTLIQASSIIYTSGCNFVDSTIGGNFEINLSVDKKRLYLTQKTGYPTTGAIIMIK